jgi:hypothetical protein
LAFPGLVITTSSAAFPEISSSSGKKKKAKKVGKRKEMSRGHYQQRHPS